MHGTLNGMRIAYVPFFTSLLSALLTTPAWADDRACSATDDDIQRDLEDTLKAFSEMDADAIDALRDQVTAKVDCLDDVISPAAAGAVHRVDAIGAFLGRDVERAELSLRSAGLADPGYVFPEEIVPSGHPLDRLAQQAAERDDAEPTEIAHPPETEIHVDGTATDLRPSDRPAIVQRADDGVLVWSGYVAMGGHLPDWTPPPPEPEPEPAPEPEPVIADAPPDPVSVARRKPTVELAVAAGGMAFVGGVFYASASVSYSRFRNANTAMEDVAGLQKRTNNLMTATLITEGAAVGLGITSALTTVRF